MKANTLSLAVLLALSSVVGYRQDKPRTRPADTIIKEIGAIEARARRPQTKPPDTPEAKAALIHEQLALVERRNALIWELYESHPDHEQVPKLLRLRWMSQTNKPETVDQAFREMDDAVARHEDSKLGIDVLAIRAEGILKRNIRKPVDELMNNVMPVIDEFMERAPDDERGATMLLTLIQQVGASLPASKEAELINRILERFPDGQHAAFIRERMDAKALVGKPLGFAFRDVVSGSEISLEGYKGRVVVLHFWATWCGSCLKELPELKALYEAYHVKGVEFVGVNLDTEDSGGLTKVKELVEANGLAWPQCYDGDRVEDSLARRCKVQAIPAVVVLDREGVVVAVEGRGGLKDLLGTLCAEANENGQETRETLPKGANAPAVNQTARKTPRTVFSAHLKPEVLPGPGGIIVRAKAKILSEREEKTLVWFVRVNGVQANPNLVDRRFEARAFYHGKSFRLEPPCDRDFEFGEAMKVPPGSYVVSVGLYEQVVDPDTQQPVEEMGDCIVMNSTDVEVPAP